MAKLELQNVVKRYGTFTAVGGVSLQAADGEVVSLLGPSGCGKTTTLQMLAGFIDPDEGAILVDGQTIHGLPPERRNTGLVFQSYALFPHMTVGGNIAFGLEMRKVSPADIASRVKRALDLVHLTGLEDRYPRQLSGGQQQRVALARALVVEPLLLLLDEPLSNLDATLREEMRFEIREIQRRVGITTIFVTHDQTEAMAISDRLAVMHKGHIVQIGTPQQVYRSPSSKFVASFIGSASLLPGQVVSREKDVTMVRVLNGATVKVGQADERFADGAEVEIVLRPEDTSIETEPANGKNALRATVTSLDYLGASTRVSVAIGDVHIAVSANRPVSTITPGAAVYIVWDAEHCALVSR